MKLIIFLAFIVFSLSSLACPELNGTYNKCTTGDRTLDQMMGLKRSHLKINQIGNDIETSFLGNTLKIKVGETVENVQRIPEERATVYSSIYSECIGDALDMKENAKTVYDNGREFETTTDYHITRDANKIVLDLVTNDNGSRFDITIKCNKKI